MSDVLENLFEELVEQKGWRKTSADCAICNSYSGDNKAFVFFMARNAENEVLRFFCEFDIKIPETMKESMLEAISLFNDKVFMGSFIFTGTQILFRYTWVVFPDAKKEALLEMVYMLGNLVCGLYDEAYPALQAVVEGRMSSEQACEFLYSDETIGNA